MQLNCKLIKKWQPPNFYIIPPLFQGYCPFLEKFLLGPMSGRSNPNPIYKRGGGTKTILSMTIKYGISWTENVYLKGLITADEVMVLIGIASIHFKKEL